MNELAQQLLGTSRIKIFVGEFGSGKTEISVNYALKLKELGIDTAIVDLDLVKPYFRVRENRILLESNCVDVVAAAGKLAHADLPIMPHDLTRVLYQNNKHVVIDVGGSKGAIVLGQLKEKLEENTYQAMLVVNTRRPFTDSVDGIINALQTIEAVSRIKVSGLISNTNLAEETTIDHIRKGIEILEEVAAKTKIPISWVAVPEWLLNHLTVAYPIFTLKRYTQYPWMG